MSAERSQFVDLETITLTKNGDWLSDGHEITHEQQIKAFARSIKRDSEGYFISIGRDIKRIIVEDTPYFVTAVRGSHENGFQLTINDGTTERLLASTIEYTPGRLICRIKSGEEAAKFLPAAYYEVMKGLQEDSSGFFLVVEGKRIELSPT